jgi:hypothetical protein
MAAVPVIDLSGVGPALSARLNELGLFTTDDLLRTERGRLAALVDGASIPQIRRWQAISGLLQIDGITVPLAEAIYAQGIETLDELGLRSLSTLRDALETVHAAGAVASVPSDDELVTWMKDATVLRLSGTLNGTVTGAKDKPLAGVAVSCMAKHAETDARGRFRLTRLPLGRALAVHLEHPDYNAKTFETRQIAPAGVLVGARFRLTKRKANAPAPRPLSELQGDVLPALSGAPIGLRVQTDPPSQRDVLRLVERMANGDARLVSRLLDYAAGVFTVREYRFKAASVPSGAKVRDHLRFVNGEWQVAAVTSHQLDHYRHYLRDLKLRPPLPPNPTAADSDRVMREWMAALEAARQREKK